eukprot:g975.t1
MILKRPRSRSRRSLLAARFAGTGGSTSAATTFARLFAVAPTVLLFFVTVVLPGPAAAALHAGDNYCDNAQDKYFCAADCKSFYYCAGSQRGQNQPCVANPCNTHGPHYLPPGEYKEAPATVSEPPLPWSNANLGSTGWGTWKEKNRLGEGAPFIPGTGGRCTAEVAARTAGAAATGCWSEAAAVAADPCSAVTCSGHGECNSATGECKCALGYTTAGGAGGAGGGAGGAPPAAIQCGQKPADSDFIDEACPSKIDIAIVIDMSTSVQQNSVCRDPDDSITCPFRAEKDFARSLLAPFTISGVFSQIAVVYFHSGAVLSLPLSTDPTRIAMAIDQTIGGGATGMGYGMGVAQAELKSRGRPGVPKLVVLVTDGQDNCHACHTEKKATEMKEVDGTHVISVGFTSGVDKMDLLKVASIARSAENVTARGPPCTNVLSQSGCKANELCLQTDMGPGAAKRNLCTAKDYYFSPTALELMSITLKLAREACPGDPTPPPPPPPPPPPDTWTTSKALDCVAGGGDMILTRDTEASSPAPTDVVCVLAAGAEGGGQRQQQQEVAAVSLGPGPGSSGSRVAQRFACVVPAYPNNNNEDGGAAGSGPWKSTLRVKVGGAVWPKAFDFVFHQCCHRPDVPIWPLFALLPFLALCAACSGCLILIQRAARLEMPPLHFAEPVSELRQPEMVTEERTVRRVVKKAPAKKPPAKKPSPSSDKKKKKNWVVTAGTYLQNGAHMEVKWGKFGEVGDTVLMDEEEEEDSDDEGKGGKGGKGTDEPETVEVLHQDLGVVVSVPKPLEVQLEQLDEVNSIVSPRSEQVGGTMGSSYGKRGPGRSRCPAGSVLLFLCSLLCCGGVIAGIVLLSSLYAAELSNDDLYGRCSTNNATTFCPEIESCLTCDATPTCGWCGDSCRSLVGLAEDRKDDGSDDPGCGERQCPPAPLPNDVWAGLAFGLFLVLLLIVACLVFLRRRRRKGTGERFAFGGPFDGFKRIKDDFRPAGYATDSFKAPAAEGGGQANASLAVRSRFEYTDNRIPQEEFWGQFDIYDVSEGFDVFLQAGMPLSEVTQSIDIIFNTSATPPWVDSNTVALVMMAKFYVPESPDEWRKFRGKTTKGPGISKTFGYAHQIYVRVLFEVMPMGVMRVFPEYLVVDSFWERDTVAIPFLAGLSGVVVLSFLIEIYQICTGGSTTEENQEKRRGCCFILAKRGVADPDEGDRTLDQAACSVSREVENQMWKFTFKKFVFAFAVFGCFMVTLVLKILYLFPRMMTPIRAWTEGLEEMFITVLISTVPLMAAAVFFNCYMGDLHEFSTVVRSFFTMVLILAGDFDVEEIFADSSFNDPVPFGSMIIAGIRLFIVMAFTNIIIVVVLEKYTTAKQDVKDVNPHFDHAMTVGGLSVVRHCCCCLSQTAYEVLEGKLERRLSRSKQDITIKEHEHHTDECDDYRKVTKKFIRYELMQLYNHLHEDAAGGHPSTSSSPGTHDHDGGGGGVGSAPATAEAAGGGGGGEAASKRGKRSAVTPVGSSSSRGARPESPDLTEQDSSEIEVAQVSLGFDGKEDDIAARSLQLVRLS